MAYGSGLLEAVREAAPEGVDAALDAVGTVEASEVSVAVVKDRGRICTLVWSTAATDRGIPRIGAQRSPAQLEQLLALCVSGALRVTVADRYPLAEAAEAHRRLATGHVRGKLVLVS